MNQLILKIEPLPITSLGKNIRNLVGYDEWKKIRQKCFRAAGGKCESCDEESPFEMTCDECTPHENQDGKCMSCGVEEGYYYKEKAFSGLYCHEKWNYNDETQTQNFEKFVALCCECHAVVHFNQEVSDIVKGAEWYIPTYNRNREAVIKQFIKVNVCDIKTFEDHENAAKIEGKRLSRPADDGRKRYWNIDMGEYGYFDKTFSLGVCIKIYQNRQKDINASSGRDQ